MVSAAAARRGAGSTNSDTSVTPGCASNDLLLSRSADGVTWSRATRIPTRPRGSTADYVLPGIGADTSRTGPIAVAFYVLRGSLLDAGFISSPNGGRSWRPARRLNVQTMRLEWIAQAGGAMVGDYISTSWAGGRAVSVFALASAPGGRFDQPLFAATFRP